ncbi:MAG: sulfatase-like hydrolase/transferase, partial [Vicingaceae bacterium]|nr:sulfatase-like hydrolase/transferase [Vicingaceae bacterium]
TQYLLVIGGFLGITAISFSVAYFFFKSNFVLKLKSKQLYLTIISFLILVLFSHITHAWAAAANYSPITKASRFYPLYFPTTSDNLIYSLNLISEEEKNANLLLFKENDHKNLNYPKQPIQGKDSVKTNIILILIDSWYYKSFNSTVTPNIYNFSKKCDVYNQHYSGDNGTRTGVFSLFYGLPGIYWYNILATHTSPVLIEELIKNNYNIEAYPSAKITSPPFNKTIFSNVKNISIETKGQETYHRDAQLTENWLQFSLNDSIRKNNNPSFSFLFYDMLHGGYHPPSYKGPFQPEWPYPKFELLNNDLDPTEFLNLYQNTAFYLDSLVGRVLIDIENKGLLENSWIIITGDHGQEFNDNKKNYWGHGSNHTKAQLQVPLIVYSPNSKKQHFNHWTSHYDIAPTLMQDVFKVKNPIFDYSIGLNLKDTSNRESLIVGSPDIFSIIQKPNKINTVFYNGTFEITDFSLNSIPEAALNVNVIDSILTRSNSFYIK